MSTTDFNFTIPTDDTESTETKLTTDDLNTDTDSAVKFIDGKSSVVFGNSTSPDLKVTGEARRGTGTGMSEHAQGFSQDQQGDVDEGSIGAEAGLHLAYDEWTFDDRIIEDGGDGGMDGQLLVDGELLDTDVKCVTADYDDAPWLKVRVEKNHKAEAFILASFDGDASVTFHGWIRAEDLMVEDNKSNFCPQFNYMLTEDWRDIGGSLDDLNEMPEPTTDREVSTSRFDFSG
jgi:hypothetical protein